jgi:hypothetical protein
LHKLVKSGSKRLGTTLALETTDELLDFFSAFPLLPIMKAPFSSFIAAAVLFATTAASAAPVDYDRDLRRVSPRERARYEQAQREQTRFEQTQREHERQQALEHARWEARHRHDRGPVRSYHR